MCVRVCVCVCVPANTLPTKLSCTSIVYKWTHEDRINVVDFTHIRGVVSRASWYCTIAKVKHHRSKGCPSIYWDLCFNLNKTLHILWGILYFAPFPLNNPRPYTNSPHAPWGVHGLSKPNNQSKDIVLWSRQEFGSTRHTAMRIYRSIWMIRLILLSQYFSSPRVIYVKLIDNRTCIT